jgi:hypothetical protein
MMVICQTYDQSITLLLQVYIFLLYNRNIAVICRTYDQIITLLLQIYSNLCDFGIKKNQKHFILLLIK